MDREFGLETNYAFMRIQNPYGSGTNGCVNFSFGATFNFSNLKKINQPLHKLYQFEISSFDLFLNESNVNSSNNKLSHQSNNLVQKVSKNTTFCLSTRGRLVKNQN